MLKEVPAPEFVIIVYVHAHGHVGRNWDVILSCYTTCNDGV